MQEVEGMKYRGMPHVAILMGTYNGCKYLSEQIESLLQQTYQNWTLFVQDDLSNDNTVDILCKFGQADPRIKIVPNDCNRGAMMNFMDLLEKTSSSYYMFCDQDDVWLPNKVELTLKEMLLTEELNPGVPVVVHTDLKVVDGNLQEISPSFWAFSRIKPSLLNSFNEMAGHNLTTGCAMMINASAKQISFPMKRGALMHDSWITNCVLLHQGIVRSVPIATILYRQHGGNVVGARDIQHHYVMNKLLAIKGVCRENWRCYQSLRCQGYGCFFKYLYFKLRYYILY